MAKGKPTSQEDFVVEQIKELKSDIKSFGESLGRVERKVFNGFGERIEAVNEKLDAETASNKRCHDKMETSITSMWKFLGGGMISIFVALISVFVLIWTSGSKTEQHVQELETTMIAILAERNEATPVILEAFDEVDDTE